MTAEMDQMIRDIQDEVRSCRNWTGIEAISPAVLDAIRGTPREAFVPAWARSCAHANRALPLDYGQTISQPLVVALMTELLAPRPEHRVLEIGAGSGYQAAVLARLVARVVSVEIVPELADAAAQRLRSLAVDNVAIHCADGHHGWPQEAPYDSILIAACTPSVPPALIEQLKPGGRMIAPIGQSYGYQELRLIEKSPDARISSRAVLPVAFVPLTAGQKPDPQ